MPQNNQNLLEPLVVNFSNLIQQSIRKIIQKQIPSNIPYKCPPRYNSKGIYIPIGQSSTGTIYLNLKDDSNSYITGTTGSGKSTCLKSVLCSLIQLYKPYELKFHLVDLKKSELFLFKNLKHTLSYTDTVEGLYVTLSDLLEECNKRFEIFARVGVADIYEYNSLVDKKMDEQILVIEELVMLLMDTKKVCLKLLKQILATSRACGIHTIMTMQRPSSDILSPLLKSLTLNKISFKQEDEANSNIAIDNPIACTINIPGRGYLKCGSTLVEFQAFNINTKQIKELIKPYLKNINSTNNPPINTSKNTQEALQKPILQVKRSSTIKYTNKSTEPLRTASTASQRHIKLNKL